MKKYSDNFSSLKRLLQQTSNRIAATILFIVAIGTMAFAQEPYAFVEGSTHEFNVVPSNSNNTLKWGMYIDPYRNIPMDPIAYNILDNTLADVVVKFEDMDRFSSEIVYLVVAETALTNGCTTKRAIQILLEPNNMYLDFAALPNADDCYNFDDNYQAQVQVGMNFTDRGGLADAAIPVSRFPIKVKYTVEDKTNAPGTVIDGNGGEYFVLEYKESNDYFLEVSEAKGSLTATTEYELTITDVVDKYDTHITHDVNRRVQIRVINHLPQTGGMDMAMAYVLTPIEYLGSN